MNNLTLLITLFGVAIFMAGLIAGVVIFYVAYKIGFKASIETRLLEDDLPDSSRLFPDRKEPAEFELLDSDKENEDD